MMIFMVIQTTSNSVILQITNRIRMIFKNLTIRVNVVAMKREQKEKKGSLVKVKRKQEEGRKRKERQSAGLPHLELSPRHLCDMPPG